VFRVSATLADGTLLQTPVLLKKSEEIRVVLLEPLRPAPQ